MIKNILATIGFVTVMRGLGKIVELIVTIRVQEELDRRRFKNRAQS